jgi:hypothetical protein
MRIDPVTVVGSRLVTGPGQLVTLAISFVEMVTTELGIATKFTWSR